MTLYEFMKLPVMERRQRFSELSAADQVAFVSTADSIELILGGYPSEERILASQTEAEAQPVEGADFPRSRDGETLH